MLGRPYANPGEKRDLPKDIELNEADSSKSLDLNTPNIQAEIKQRRPRNNTDGCRSNEASFDISERYPIHNEFSSARRA